MQLSKVLKPGTGTKVLKPGTGTWFLIVMVPVFGIFRFVSYRYYQRLP